MKILFIILGVSFYAWIRAEEEGLSLEDALVQGVQYNFELSRDRILTEVNRGTVEIEERQFRLKLEPLFAVESSAREVSLTRFGLRVERELRWGTRLEARGEVTRREEGDSEEELELRLEQPLFKRFGPLAAESSLESARFAMRQADWNLHLETERLMIRIVNRFTEVLKRERDAIRETEALARADDFVKLLELRERQGRATEVEVLEMKMLRQEAALRVRFAESASRREARELARLLGRTPEQLPELQEASRPPMPDLGEKEPEQVAREQRVELKQAMDAYKEARRQVDLQRREFYPDLRLLANYKPVLDGSDEEWFVGISGGQTLDVGVKRIEYSQKEEQARAALIEIAVVELRILREVRDAADRLETLEEEWDLAQQQLSLAERRWKTADALYQRGRSSATALREAEERLVDAQTLILRLQAERIRALYEWRQVLGLLLD